MIRKNVIIGAFTNYNWEQIRPWAESIETCGFDGLKVVIVYNADFDVCLKLQERGFKVITPGITLRGKVVYKDGQPFSIWNERFRHAHLFLIEYMLKNPNTLNNVIMTDVKDVVFQKDPFDDLDNMLGNQYSFVASSEDIAYRNEPWGDDNLKKTFPHLYDYMRHETVVNVGVVAGRAWAMAELFLLIYQMTLDGDGQPTKFVSDQSAYNVLMHGLLRNQTLHTNHDDRWACQLGTTADPSKLESFRPNLLCDTTPHLRDDVVCNGQLKPYAIVHQYDRVPEWRDKILALVQRP